MNWFSPFPLIVPAQDKAHLVASRSYVSYGKAELQDKLNRNPYSYLHVINPAGSKPASAKRGSEGFYQLVRSKYEAFKDLGWIEQLPGNRMAIYRQSTADHACTGIIGTVSIQGINEGRLKLHEQTLEKRERLFAKYLDIVGCHAEPILSMFADDSEAGASVAAYFERKTKERPELDFSTTDEIRHTVWVLNETESEELSAAFDLIPCLYLADGHHRVASSQRLHEKYPLDSGKDRILAFAVPESQLLIRGYHRELKGIPWNADEWQAAFARHADAFQVRALPTGSPAPEKIGVIHVHSAAGSWRLERRSNDPIVVDAMHLQQQLFEPELGIIDARNDPRISYLPGTWSSEALQQRALTHPDRMIIELHPVLTTQVKGVADAGGYLPPKSTWIEPKLRSGLFIFELQ